MSIWTQNCVVWLCNLSFFVVHGCFCFGLDDHKIIVVMLFVGKCVKIFAGINDGWWLKANFFIGGKSIGLCVFKF